MSSRDNFPQRVINKLKDRVASRCSNPDCRAPTSAPSSTDSVNNIGVAAHICAAAPGGPRYDEKMSHETRSSIQNGIWLCSSCSVKIDRDEERYTVAVLQKWKTNAEAAAVLELGKQPPKFEDSIKVLQTAFTGEPSKHALRAVSNVHEACSAYLSSIDPRFKVRTEFIDNQHCITIEPTTGYRLTFRLKNDVDQNQKNSVSSFVRTGGSLKMPANIIEFEKNPLVDELAFNNATDFTISTRKTAAILKTTLTNQDKTSIKSFYDIQGYITSGTDFFQFNGNACGGVFSIDIVIPFAHNKDNPSNFTMRLNWELWNKLPIKELPFLYRIHDLFVDLIEGWLIGFELEANGLFLIKSHYRSLRNYPTCIDLFHFVKYIRYVEVVATRANVKIYFNSDFVPSNDEYQFAREISTELTQSGPYTRNHLQGNITCTISNADESMIRTFDDGKKRAEALFKTHYTKTTLLNQSIGRIEKEIVLNDVIIKAHRNKSNRTTSLTIVPQDNFSMHNNFVFV